MDKTNKNNLKNKLESLKLPEVKMEKHQEQLKSDLSNVRKSGILGAFIIMLIVLSLGGRLIIFVGIPSLIFTGVIPFALITATYGFKGLTSFFTGLFNTNVVGEKREFLINVFKDFKTYFVVCGWLGTIGGTILMLAYVTEYAEILQGTSVALLTIFYGYVLAYLYCYPILRRLENNP